MGLAVPHICRVSVDVVGRLVGWGSGEDGELHDRWRANRVGHVVERGEACWRRDRGVVELEAGEDGETLEAG